jgi:chromosome segregation ATPase
MSLTLEDLLSIEQERNAELERELEECKHDIERHIAIVEELERERDEARERIVELERELKITNGFHDVAVKERDYERLIVDKTRQRIAELEDELNWAAEKVKRLVVERDEARKLARMYRTVAAMDNPPELPWEEKGE